MNDQEACNYCGQRWNAPEGEQRYCPICAPNRGNTMASLILAAAITGLVGVALLLFMQPWVHSLAGK